MAKLSHSQGWSCTLLLLVFPCVFSASSTSDAPAASYRTTTSEVRVAFFATDQNNHPVESVEQDDFAVVDSGFVIRDFRSLTRSNETALDVVLLVDASESVAPRFRATVNDVLQLVSEESAAADNVSVVSFAGLRPVLLCTGDCRGPEAAKKLLAVKAAGVTPLFDTLTYAADFLSRRQSAGVRPVLILFSDGYDTISMTSAHDALEAVIASGAPLYTIDLSESGHDSAGSAVLQQMAEATGGRSFCIRDGAVNVLQAVLGDLRASYLVTYLLPSRAPGFHPLHILPKHNLKLRFHCRSGYYYEKDRP